ncbi:MAG: beta-lactamase family protein [Dehalococcoidales bacterium]|nr:beta-lactamase family protein [Dehalococcoidales bacterium]
MAIKGSLSILPLVLSLLAWGLLGCSQPQPEVVSNRSEPFPKIDEYIQQQMEYGDIPGLSVAIVQHGEILYLKGFGVTSLSNPSPVTPQTVFDLASISKSFTALGVMLLANEGLIDLDTTVQHYLADFQPDDPRASQITVRQLLNQTSGLPGTFSEPLIYYQGSDAMRKMLAAVNRVHLNQEPGLSFEYANINYAILGALVERLSGVTFEDYMQQEVFTPMGMTSTTLYPEEAAKLERADGHQPMFGQVVARNIPYFRSASPVGWVMSSAEDMVRWLTMLLNKGGIDQRQIFPAAVISEMQTPAATFVENDQVLSYGIGLYIKQEPDLTPIIWHGGDTPNFLSDMLLIPDQQFGVVVLTNSQATTIGHNIAPGVANLILGLELKMGNIPWWAHWEAIDNIATGALSFITLLALGGVGYGWYIWRQFRNKNRHFIGSAQAGAMPPAWQAALNMTPLAIFILFALAGYLVLHTLYGYNLYEVLVLFQAGSPPGIYIVGVALVLVVFLWALLLAFITLFTRSSKTT